MKKIAVIAYIMLLIGLVASPIYAAETVLFSDSFDSENGGVFALDYQNFKRWIVVSGSVDLLGGVDNSEDGYPASTGMFIELDGTGDAGGVMITRNKFTMVPGIYRLRFVLGNRADLDSLNQCRISIGTSYEETFFRRGFMPFRVISRIFTVESSPDVERARITIEHLGPSNRKGILINSIRLSLVEPL